MSIEKNNVKKPIKKKHVIVPPSSRPIKTAVLNSKVLPKVKKAPPKIRPKVESAIKTVSKSKAKKSVEKTTAFVPLKPETMFFDNPEKQVLEIEKRVRSNTVSSWYAALFIVVTFILLVGGMFLLAYLIR